MANTWLETFLGVTGKYVLSFLDKYYFYFIPVILAYGIFMTLSSFNLKRIEKRLIKNILSQARKITAKDPDIGFIGLTERLDISLFDIIAKSSFFPFISSESGLWPLRTNTSNVRDMILFSERRILLLLKRKGMDFSEYSLKPRENLYLEVIHKITDTN